MHQLVFFLFVFGMLLIFGSFFICGLYTTTRGYYGKHVNGEPDNEGFIFKSWYFFWYRKRDRKKERQYVLGALYLLTSQIKAATAINLQVSEDGITVYAPVEFSTMIRLVQYQFKVKVKKISTAINTGNIGDEYSLIEEDDIYVFPECIRKVMAGCITCFASVYGSVLYWSFILFSTPHTIYCIFGWSNHQRLLIIATWIFYCFSLAYLNTVFWAKTKING